MMPLITPFYGASHSIAAPAKPLTFSSDHQLDWNNVVIAQVDTDPNVSNATKLMLKAQSGRQFKRQNYHFIQPNTIDLKNPKAVSEDVKQTANKILDLNPNFVIVELIWPGDSSKYNTDERVAPGLSLLVTLKALQEVGKFKGDIIVLSNTNMENLEEIDAQRFRKLDGSDIISGLVKYIESQFGSN